jgi:hypothetical protein
MKIAPLRQTSTKIEAERHRSATSSHLATTAGLGKLKQSSLPSRDASTNKAGPPPQEQKRRTAPSLLLATKAGQEKRSQTPSRAELELPLATMAGQEPLLIATNLGEETCSHRIIEEGSSAAHAKASLQPLEQKQKA